MNRRQILTSEDDPRVVSTIPICICICILRGSTHYCAIPPRMLSHHIVDFLESRRMETAPTSIEVLLRPTLVQSDEPSDLHGSLSPTTRQRCTHILVYTAPVVPGDHPSNYGPGPALLIFSDRANTDELTPYSVLLLALCRQSQTPYIDISKHHDADPTLCQRRDV